MDNLPDKYADSVKLISILSYEKMFLLKNISRLVFCCRLK